MYAPNNIASKYIKQQTVKMGEMDELKIIFEDFSTTLSEYDTSSRSKISRIFD